MINKIIAVIRYNISVFLFNVRFTWFSFEVEMIKQQIERLKIILLLKIRGVGKEKIKCVLDRYFIHKSYLTEKESIESRRKLMSFISEWADKIGISQWEARELLNRDFHIDI